MDERKSKRINVYEDKGALKQKVLVCVGTLISAFFDCLVGWCTEDGVFVKRKG